MGLLRSPVGTPVRRSNRIAEKTPDPSASPLSASEKIPVPTEKDSVELQNMGSKKIPLGENFVEIYWVQCDKCDEWVNQYEAGLKDLTETEAEIDDRPVICWQCLFKAYSDGNMVTPSSHDGVEDAGVCGQSQISRQSNASFASETANNVDSLQFMGEMRYDAEGEPIENREMVEENHEQMNNSSVPEMISTSWHK